MQIRPATFADASAIADIYNFYIQNSHATFETDPIDPNEMRHRLEDIGSYGYPFLVAVIDEEIVGYAYGSRHRAREAYRFSAEASIYIRNGNEGKGIGSALYESLLPELARCGIHAIIAGISLPNASSIKLHERFGFQKVAHFREVGHKLGRWIDVAYWELIP